jgi:hypothetical protein
MMKTPQWSTVRAGLSALLAAGALLAAAPGATLLAQDVDVTRDACRCVDREGGEIENCRCIRGVDPQGIMGGLFMVREPRARIGISLDPAQDEASGARVASVVDGGPADGADLREGDVIIRVDGQSLLEALDDETERGFDAAESLPVQRLLSISEGLDPEDEVEIEYLRGGEAFTATVIAQEVMVSDRFRVVSPNWDQDAMHLRMRELTERLRGLRGDEGSMVLRLQELADTSEAWSGEGPRGFTVIREGEEGPRVVLERLLDEVGERDFVVSGFGTGGTLVECPGAEESRSGGWFAYGSNCVGGLELMELKPGLADYFGTETGVLVTDVHAESQTGLQAGDVIQRIGDREATTPTRAMRILRSYAGDEDVIFHILRRGDETSVTGRLGR